jgi:hypothetical protein
MAVVALAMPAFGNQIIDDFQDTTDHWGGTAVISVPGGATMTGGKLSFTLGSGISVKSPSYVGGGNQEPTGFPWWNLGGNGYKGISLNIKNISTSTIDFTQAQASNYDFFGVSFKRYATDTTDNEGSAMQWFFKNYLTTLAAGASQTVFFGINDTPWDTSGDGSKKVSWDRDPSSNAYGMNTTADKILLSGWVFNLSSADGWKLEFSDFQFAQSAAPIPEPGTMLLLGTGALGVFGWMRRRKMK